MKEELSCDREGGVSAPPGHGMKLSCCCAKTYWTSETLGGLCGHTVKERPSCDNEGGLSAPTDHGMNASYQGAGSCGTEALACLCAVKEEHSCGVIETERVKEPLSENETALVDLFVNHEVNKELVLGPECFQRPGAPLATTAHIPLVMEPVKEEPPCDSEGAVNAAPADEVPGAGFSEATDVVADLYNYDVKKECESEACGVSETERVKEPSCESETTLADLYLDHEVKNELVLGPECLHRAPFAPPGGVSKSTPQNVTFRTYTATYTPKNRCKTCGKEFNRYDELYKHMQIHTSLKPYTCEICGKKFRQASHLESHLPIHTALRPYHCKICEKTFKRPCDLKNHMASHTEARPYPCKICGKGFKHSSHVKRHIVVHTARKLYSCEICKKVFSGMTALKGHQLIHTGLKAHSCDICNKAFRLASTLEIHKRIHTGDKPYSCKRCNKRFTQLSHFKTHQLIHLATKKQLSSKKQLTCVICKMNFIHLSSLKTHERFHTGIKPYSWDLCNEAFTDSANFKRRKQVQTGEKPY